MPRLLQHVPPPQLLPAFDQQAAAALLVRKAVEQADGGAPPAELLTVIDRGLISTMKMLCHYQKGDPSTVLLPPHAAQLPGLVFHLRRSPAVRTTGFSPDETAYFRQLSATLSTFTALVAVQPTLMGYERGSGDRGVAMPLEPHAMAPERSLILDTFVKLILCHGAGVANLKRAPGAASDPSLQAMLDAIERDRSALEDERFPSPEVFECEQYGSKARYLVQKLNPDVPLATFLEGLYKAIVAA